jgi:hypothetical protein
MNSNGKVMMLYVKVKAMDFVLNAIKEKYCNINTDKMREEFYRITGNKLKKLTEIVDTINTIFTDIIEMKEFVIPIDKKLIVLISNNVKEKYEKISNAYIIIETLFEDYTDIGEKLQPLALLFGLNYIGFAVFNPTSNETEYS